MYSFDGQNRIITLDTGVIEFDVQDLYSRWKEWAQASDNAKWTQGMRSIGGEPIGGGQFVSAFIILINGWRVRPHEANHGLAVIGNLITDTGDDPFVPTIGPFNVQIKYQVTSNSITTVIEGAFGGDNGGAPVECVCSCCGSSELLASGGSLDDEAMESILDEGTGQAVLSEELFSAELQYDFEATLVDEVFTTQEACL